MSEMKSKRCSKCLIEKELGEFSKSKSSKDRLQHHCKSCNKEYLIKNNDYIAKRRQEYYIKNKEEFSRKYKIYSQTPKAKELRKQHQQKYHAKPDIIIKTNANKLKYYRIFKNQLAGKIRHRLWCAFSGATKSARTEELLNCPFEFFQDYILSKCPPEWTTENYGKVWVLDHIVPISRFDFTDSRQVAKCCHYSNWQPLSKIDNLIKGNTFELVRRDVYILD